MALTLEAAARNAMCDALVDLIDGGVGSNGTVVIKTAGGSTLASIDTADPAFGAASSGVATAASLPLSATASGTGTAAIFDVENKAGTKLWSGTVGLTGSGADMIIDSTAITSGDTVNITAWTVTVPASA